MLQISVLFQGLVTVAAVSMILLAVGSLITRQLQQPIERIRCVQWTFAALLVALVVRQASLLPALSLEVLPAESAVAEIVTDPQVIVSPMATETTGTDPSFMKSTAVFASDFALDSSDSVAAAGPLADADVLESWFTFNHSWFAVQVACLSTVTFGAGWSLVLLAIGRWRLTNILRRCEPASEALLSAWADRAEAEARQTRVYVSPAASVPMTSGVRKPVIVLPRRLAESADSRAIAYCLSHEWAHVRSRDVATWWMVHLMQPLLWFQPLFWYLRRELRTAQDQLADDFATRRVSDRAEYATLLMGFAKERMQWEGSLALTMADRRSTLYRRIELLFADQFHLANVARRRVVFGTVACMAILAVTLGVLRLERAAAASPDTAAKPVTDDASKASTEQESEDAKTKDGTEPQVTGNLEALAATKVQEPDEDAPVELAYSGTIVNKQTKLPVAGASVVVRRMILKSYDRKVIEESEHKTNLLGRYSFKIPPEQTAEKSLYIELDVSHPDYAWKKGFGYALSMIRKNERLGEKPFFSHVELSPSDPISGRVVDPDGKPIAGVHIQSYSKGDADDFRDYGSFFKTQTDEDGKFRLQMVKGGPSIFWVIPEDYAPVQVVSGTKRGDWGDINVKDGVAISGQVVGATGAPVAGVWVNLQDEQSQREIQMPVASSMNRSAMSDKEGKFTLAPMKPGTYRINVGDYPREVKFHKRGRKPIEVDEVFVAKHIEIGPEDADRPFTIQAVPHVEFHGQYLDSKGEPRSGHRVSFFGQLDGQWYHTNIAPDKNGKIVGKLPHGLTEARMDAITNEHSAIQVRLKKDGPLLAGRRLDLGTIEDDVTGVEIIRYTAPIVQVKPVDEEGKAIGDCMVSGIYADGKDETMMPVGGMATNVSFEKQTDGRHRTSQLIPNRKIKFTAKAEGYEEASETLELPEGEEQEVVLVLKKSELKEGDSANAE